MIKNFKLKIKNSSGFTFIELIVVITIIAILSVAGVISYSSATRKSRDSRRISDLEKMRMALEMERQIGTTYPVDINSLVNDNFLDKIPTDPKTGNTYPYVQSSNGYKYTINAFLEDASSSDTGTTAYQVRNP